MNIIINKHAPAFTLTNTEGEEVSLSDFNGEKKVVLLFFPLAFSSVCTDELCTTRDNMKLYNSMDAKVLAISVDSFFALNAFKKAENLNFTLLSDFNKSVSAQYDSLYEEYYGMRGVSKRSAFVIDHKGIVKYREILEDSGSQPDFDAISDILAALG